MVKHLSTYLFDEPTHLVNTFMRGMDKPRERWTLPEVSGKRLSKIPVYILTSRKTFSAAESFTFGLVVNKRVMLVGERTGGGGHFGGPQPLVDGYGIWIPRGRTYDPKTDQGWESIGLKPDIEVPYEQALAAALDHAKSQKGK
jgi:C-terminal processing protease CtpA/Prc